MRYAVVMLYTFQPAWLRLSRLERRAFEAEVLAPILARFPEVVCRHFDAEAFSGRCSDFALFETASLERYYALLEALRDTDLWRVPYLSVQEMVLGLEDGFRGVEQAS